MKNLVKLQFETWWFKLQVDIFIQSSVVYVFHQVYTCDITQVLLYKILGSEKYENA